MKFLFIDCLFSANDSCQPTADVTVDPLSPPASNNCAAASVFLGNVELPSGVLLLLDPGLANYWKHDEEPPPWKGGADKDFAIVGPDAIAAGRAFDRQFDPRFVFDIPEKGLEQTSQAFAELCEKHGLDAILVPMEQRMPHVQRAYAALEIGDGLGIAQYAGMWSVVVGGFAPGTPLAVHATPMPPGEFAGRWKRIELIDEGAGEEASTREIDGVMVDHGQFIFSDLEAFGQFRMWHALDGLGDFVFWGADAAALAAETTATELEGGQFGWMDVPLEDLKVLIQPVARAIDERNLRVAQDYRPHCNLERLNAQVRRGPPHAGTLTLAGSRVVGIDNSWGDGIFTVTCHADASGRVARVAFELGTEERCRRLRHVVLRSRFAVVSKSITDDAEPLHFGDRSAPDRPEDSGWWFTCGRESDEQANDPEHYTIMPLGRLIDQTPGLEMCLDLPPGSLIRREGDGFVVESQ